MHPIVVIDERSQFLIADRAMNELVDALDALLQEHRCCGQMDSGAEEGRVDDLRVWCRDCPSHSPKE